jgi:hypothetical protein
VKKLDGHVVGRGELINGLFPLIFLNFALL